MKKLIPLAIVLFTLLANAKAQDASRKVLQVHTIYLNMTQENANVNTDSLLRIYKRDVFDKNPYYLNTKIVRHWYGHDSREVLMISELKSWDDIEKADAKRTEIIGQLKKCQAWLKQGNIGSRLFLPNTIPMRFIIW